MLDTGTRRRLVAVIGILLSLAVLISPASVATADPGHTPTAEPAGTPTSGSPTPTPSGDEVSSPTPEGPTSEPSDAATAASPEPSEASTPAGSTAPDSQSSAPSPDTPSANPEVAKRSIGALAVVTTSGVLRDSRTGAPIRSSCVAYRTATASQTNYSNVNQDGTFSFQTDDVDGPVSIAFYVVANFDCSGPVLSSSYLPSWYQGQPFTGTDPGTAMPPSGATPVSPGSTNIVACLAPDALAASCATPNTTFSGRVTTIGSRPIDQACIVVINPDSGVTGPGITAADGRWRVTGLPNDTPLVIGVIPPSGGSGPPCQFEGPPPAPAPGQLQPEFYRNIWVDLNPDPNNPLFQDPYAWAIEHGAATVTNSSSGLDVCLTTDPGSVVPRPSCASDTPSPTPTATTTSEPAPTRQPANGPNLAETGGPSAWLLALAAGLLTVGAAALHRSTGLRRRQR